MVSTSPDVDKTIARARALRDQARRARYDAQHAAAASRLVWERAQRALDENKEVTRRATVRTANALKSEA
jgi:hypothetical protein